MAKTAQNGIKAKLWQLYHKLGSPRWFYQMSGRWLPWLAVIAAVLLITGTIWGLFYAPADFKQGNSFRIIYIHVPAAFIALAGYYIMAIAGAIALIWRMKMAEIVLRVCAPIGAAMTFIALFTGAVWGKPTWGTWWVWDARITSMLVLFFLYLGVLALAQAYERDELGGKAAAILALVGTVNIPIIYKSVDWWYSLHQPATLKLTEKPSMHPDMLWPLLIMVVGTYVLYAVLVIIHARAEILRREQRTSWVKELVKL
ncbi:Heme exporter protein C [BD1-7 clade bacterium]|uniref:Heme exporter protein C n=1 Tax=BD1-7 clade bacterium TaxID=2029982 RepID=A0A5S9NMW9_9GAMM|nr:Heme exporter protein C [BD1-7 clade bacterium]CAA0093644.1 Heme exporter protein C [BD1-7 clade bacterium]